MFTAKYSTTTPTNALRPSPGNVAISVDAGEDGPTSTTGWYNGFKIPEGGYLVIQSTSGNDPDYFPIANDTEMINLAKYTFGQSSISQVRDSLFYFLNNANTIVLDRIPNNVVTTDAFLNIDMSVLASYSSTERTILDLSGNQATGRVNNAPSYKPDQGVLSFDGVDENITYGSPLCAGLDAWSWQSTVAFDVIQEGATSPYYQLYIEEAAIWIAQYANAVGIDMRQDSANVWFDGNGGTNTGAQIGLGNILPGTFNHFTWTLEQPDLLRGYFNGELEVTIPTGQNGPIRTGTNVTCIASRNGTKFFDGQMRDTKTYASTLTEEQVRQNYHLAPIVTNGLVFGIDGGNLVSYNPGDTSTFSLSPTNVKQNNPIGTLTNGADWDNRGSGTWTFDGVDDRINFDGIQILNSIGVTSGADNDVDYSMEAWIKLNAYPEGIATQGDSIMGHNSALGIGLQVFGNGSNAYVNFGYRTNSNYNSNSFLNLNQWYHIVGTREVGGYLRIYINGVVDYAVSGDLKVDYDTVNFGVGNSPSRIGPFNGDIAICRIYDRALTETEVSQNFEANRNRFGL